ncbi:MAG: hypothetical protein APF76_08685 [Desulfitibacter sp. BRH_c19]|nr:MAG: hypothetical protein APF76_08685 [Desulfitibacter sp. BRH_c19]
MRFKKGDLVIIILLIAASISWFMKDIIWPNDTNNQAVIKIDGQIHTTIPLDSSNERKEIALTLPDDNDVHSIIVTEKDKIWVEESSCPNKICVNTGEISKPSQSIVCLPNKVVIYIEGSEKTDIDDVSF